VLTLEEGKTLADARSEVAVSADVIEWYAEEGRRAYGRVVPGATPGMRQLVVLEPVGVALAITPWNFPALTPCRKIGGALAAGCSLILKASEETPGTMVEIARALHDCRPAARCVESGLRRSGCGLGPPVEFPHRSQTVVYRLGADRQAIARERCGEPATHDSRARGARAGVGLR